MQAVVRRFSQELPLRKLRTQRVRARAGWRVNTMTFTRLAFLLSPNQHHPSIPPRTMSISQPDPTKLRHLSALTHHLAQLSASMSETEQRFARLQNLLLAMQAFGGGQAAQCVPSPLIRPGTRRKMTNLYLYPSQVHGGLSDRRPRPRAGR